jgi:beta-phosphoglucomutase-like phosphatase (HAD superfamily)
MYEPVFLTWTVHSLLILSLPGLLIDSERIYTQVTNSILASHGKGPVPAEIKARLMGTAINYVSNVRTPWTTRMAILCDIDVGGKGLT